MHNTYSEIKQNRILVTGGAGFIGSHLCRELIRGGNQVICLDNFMTGKPDHVADLKEHPDFSMVNADVTEPLQFEVDQIYHLACPASPVHYREDPIFTAKTCFLGALHVLELAEKTKARVLLASTSEVYGEPMMHPQREDYRGNVNPNGPRACYDEGKRIAETLFFDAWRTKGIDIRVVRIFNTYGPCMEANDGRVISNFVTQALQGDDITIYGEGSQTRSFCYVEDTVEGLIRMMGLEAAGKKTAGSENTESGAEDLPAYLGPVNLGNPSERTVREVAEEILRQTGSRSRIVFGNLPDDDPTRRRPDITRAKKLLDWRPTVPFEEGVARTIAYFREQLASRQEEKR